jgi:hypothetical protein
MFHPSGTVNIITALGQGNRVCDVYLWSLAGWQLEQVLAAMQVPFTELTDLRLLSNGGTMPAIPDSFLDGSAPRLRFFLLSGIPFPGLPKLLLSATHLVNLNLENIPHSGYISPEAIVALISVLSCLKWLTLRFQSPQSRPDRETRRPPSSKRFVIPALTSLSFKGVTEYLEVLVTGIDTPQLDRLNITFFNQIDFDTPQLAQFINRTPNLGKRDATVEFYDSSARVELSPGKLEIAISCRELDWQLSSIEQVCNSSLHPLSTVGELKVERGYRQRDWKNDAIENTLWLQLLLPFTAVKNLYLSEEFASGIAAALQELVGGRITEVLPSLQNIFVKGVERSGPFQEKIGQFVAARQLSDHPVAISVWNKDSKATKNERIIMITQPIPPFTGKKSQPAAQPSKKTYAAAAAATNKLNVNATSFRPNPKAVAFTPVIYHRFTRVNSLTLLISVSRLPRTRLLVHRRTHLPRPNLRAYVDFTYNPRKPVISRQLSLQSLTSPPVPNPFFGKVVLKNMPVLRVKDDFNPFKFNKVAEASAVSSYQTFLS